MPEQPTLLKVGTPANSFWITKLRMQRACAVRVRADEQLRVVMRIVCFHFKLLQLLRASFKARAPLKTVCPKLGGSQVSPCTAAIFCLHLQVQSHASLLRNNFVIDPQLIVTNGVTLEVNDYNRFAHQAWIQITFKHDGAMCETVVPSQWIRRQVSRRESCLSNSCSRDWCT